LKIKKLFPHDSGHREGETSERDAKKIDTMDGDMKKIMQTMERIEAKLDTLLASRKKKRVRVVTETPPSLLKSADAENTTEKDMKGWRSRTDPMWPEGRIRPYDGGQGEAVKSGGTGFWDLGFDTEDEDDRKEKFQRTPNFSENDEQ
jgi:hypothetical protein